MNILSSRNVMLTRPFQIQMYINNVAQTTLKNPKCFYYGITLQLCNFFREVYPFQ